MSTYGNPNATEESVKDDMNPQKENGNQNFF